MRQGSGGSWDRSSRPWWERWSMNDLLQKSIKSSLQLNNHHARAVVKKGFDVHIGSITTSDKLKIVKYRLWKGGCCKIYLFSKSSKTEKITHVILISFILLLKFLPVLQFVHYIETLCMICGRRHESLPVLVCVLYWSLVWSMGEDEWVQNEGILIVLGCTWCPPSEWWDKCLGLHWRILGLPWHRPSPTWE